MNKYEKLIEHIINDETDAARALFHTIVVEKSRDIYESLIDEEDLEEVGGNQVDDLVDEVTCDEEGMTEEEEFGGDMDDEEGESSFDYDASGDLDDHEEDHGDYEDRLVDLETAFNELQAEFDALMADEENEPEHHDGISDPDFGSEESEEGEEEEGEEEMDENLVREYVEKVGDFYKGNLDSPEGKLVGKDGSVPVNKSTPLAGKNDMGGSAKNIANGSSNKSPDGTSANKGEMNAYKKGEGNLPGAGSYENVPGAKAGKAFAKKGPSYEANHGKEGQTTSGKVPVSTKSEIGGKIR